MKGILSPNHIPLNKYKLFVVGLVPLTPVTIGEIEEELQTVDLPDRTRASGGYTSPTSTEVGIAMSEHAQMFAMEAWFADCQGSVAANYKKSATLIYEPIGVGISRIYQLHGVFPQSRGTPAVAMENEGELAVVSWTLSIDSIYTT